MGGEDSKLLFELHLRIFFSSAANKIEFHGYRNTNVKLFLSLQFCQCPRRHYFVATVSECFDTTFC